MKKTQKKILTNAIQLFNKRGVGNVRLQDIAKKAGISAGNLSYHYKTKKDLMEAVLEYMTEELKTMRSANMSFLEQDDYISLIKTYLRFQIGHRFFYRDILEIMNLVPEAKDVFENQMQQVLNFSKNGIYLAIGKGIMLPEPYEGHYELFAKNIWAIMQARLMEREVFGEDKSSLHNVIVAVLESHYPYLTDKGKMLFGELKSRLPQMVEEEVSLG
ncbi:MAG: TetR/AcrR family transcriptional regulator [Chitinophagales bacterium]